MSFNEKIIVPTRNAVHEMRKNPPWREPCLQTFHAEMKR